jgi:hypothetical protein
MCLLPIIIRIGQYLNRSSGVTESPLPLSYPQFSWAPPDGGSGKTISVCHTPRAGSPELRSILFLP